MKNLDITDFLVITAGLGFAILSFLAVTKPEDYGLKFEDKLDTVLLAVIAFGKAESKKENHIKSDEDDEDDNRDGFIG